jgi:hypothetical protein
MDEMRKISSPPLVLLATSFLVNTFVHADVFASNDELTRMFDEDQSDREPSSGQPINWVQVSQRDQARRERALVLYRSAALKTGEDLYHVAMILQHGSAPEDYLLAHELCVAAIFSADTDAGAWMEDAKWLAAASEDRFLSSIGRKQRFGTQFRSDDVEFTLEPMEEGITDEIRKLWSVPTLAQAKVKGAELTRESLESLKHPELRQKLLELSPSDANSLPELHGLVHRYGWPGAHDVGFKAADAAFAILNTASEAEKERILPALRKTAQTDLLTSTRTAFIEDQLRVSKGRPQIYGTAVKREPDGTVTVLPVEKPESLDARRHAVGLPPMREFLEAMKAGSTEQAPPGTKRDSAASQH